MSERRPNLFWPIILIGAGVIFLLSNTGAITGNPWPVIFNLWPVLLIAAGLDILFGRRSMAGAFVGAVLGLLVVAFAAWVLIAKPDLPGLGTSGAALQTRHVEAPLNDIQTADVTIDFASGDNRLAAMSDSRNLVEGDLSYYGDLQFSADGSGTHSAINIDTSFFAFFFFGSSQGEKWDIRLNTRPTYDVNLDLGSGGATLDFAQLKLSGGTIDVGSGSTELSLPTGGTFTLRVDGGSGSLRIRLPRQAGLRVEIDPGSGSFNPGSRLQLIGERSRSHEVYETEGFSSAAGAITLMIDGGSGSITVEDAG